MRWQRYWFAEGGRTSAAILRVAIGIAVLWSLHRLHSRWPASAPGPAVEPTRYRAVGVWMLLGDRPPPGATISMLWMVARVSTVAMVLGACSRMATAISFLAFVALASLSYAGFRSWSHPYNPVLLAQLAFLGARGGDTLSLDALVRRLRGRAPLCVGCGYQWSIRLVQLAVAVVFASAAFHKLLGAGFTLRWITTDNLRHHLLIRYDLVGRPRPAIADWLIDDVRRYRAAAAMNMLAQTVPILACVFIGRPVLRAICGLCFVLETVALALVMQFWNLEWIPLAAVFIDWDALHARIAHRAAAPSSWRPPRAAAAFVIAFVAYDLATAFVPRLDQRLNTYPFTSFPMFATLRVRRPYDQHLPYAIPAGRFEVIAEPPIAAARWLDEAYRATYTTGDRAELRDRLVGILAETERRYPDAKISAIRLSVVILEAPPYPAHARFEPHEVGLLAEVRGDRTFVSKLGAPLPPRAYFRDDSPEPHAEAVAGWVYAVAVDGDPWIVARRRTASTR